MKTPNEETDVAVFPVKSHELLTVNEFVHRCNRWLARIEKLQGYRYSEEHRASIRVGFGTRTLTDGTKERVAILYDGDEVLE